MSEAEDVEVVASGLALQQVSQWLGVSAEDALQEDNTHDELFTKLRPQLLGLGAKHVSHKSMEQLGLELKLKQRLRKSAEDSAVEYAQLDRHTKKQKQAEVDARQLQNKPAGATADSDMEDEGKLGALKQQVSKTQHKVLHWQELLAVPSEKLSKWQRRRMRQKEKQQPASS